MTPEEIIAAIAAAGAQDPNAPIGVPAGYQPPGLRGAGTFYDAGVPLPPDQISASPYRPGAELVYASAPPEQIVAVQQRLVDAGLLRGTFRVGVWDQASRNAYKTVLGYANQLGTKVDYAFERWIASGLGEYDTTPAQERAPFSAEVTHPDDIRAGLREFFRDKTGTGKIDDAKLDAMVRAWQGEEVTAQRAAYDAAPTGGTVTATRDFGSFAEEQAQKVDPVGFRAHEYLDKFSAIAGMLGGQDPSVGGQV